MLTIRISKNDTWYRYVQAWERYRAVLVEKHRVIYPSKFISVAPTVNSSRLA